MIKLKNILSEAYAWERQEGKPLPTLAEVQAAYQAKMREEAKPDFYQDVFNVDLGDQKPGMYFVSIITKEGKTTKKLLIY